MKIFFPLVILAGWFLFVHFTSKVKMFFTKPRQGTVEFVMAGGIVVRAIMVAEGRKLGKDHPEAGELFPEYEVVTGTTSRSLLHYLFPWNWFEHWGYFWVGIPPFRTIYRYDFVWTEEHTDADGKVIPCTRRATQKDAEGQTAFIFVKDVNYFVLVERFTTKGGLPMQAMLLITVRIENPFKALFRGTNWLERTTGGVRDMTNRYGGAVTYEQFTAGSPAELTAKDGSTLKTTLEELIKKIGDGLPDEVHDTDLLTDYGVRIVGVKLHSYGFVFASDAERLAYEQATTRKYTLDQEGQGELAKARSMAEAIKVTADADSYRIEKVDAKIAGDPGLTKIRGFQAMEKAHTTYVVPDKLVGIFEALGTTSR